MAERLDENAGAVLSADRKTNTARRAAMASRAEAAANADKALAQTMRNIAAAIEDGSASMLDRVRAKTQIELLSSLTNLARDAELRQKYATAEEREKHRGGRVTADTAAYAEFPRYEAFRSDLAELARKLSDNDGTKKIGQKLLKVADDVTDAYLKFAKENTTKVSHFARGAELAEYASREDAERALKKAGLTGKAIVLPIKRGQNRIVLSPSEAIARGLWDGDSDKRLALSAGLAAELIEAVGRRTKGVEVPWQLQTAHERVQALKRLGIETPAELRAALREFIALREGVKEPDRIKQLEREMVGRQKDGLDFFPTPASVADQLVETAAVEPGMSVLEPSAGMGHIAERIREAGVEPDVIELSGKRRELLEAKGFNIVGSDFVETQPVAGYDRIIMNPPFSDRRDAEHVRHAYDILKPGGRLVAIMGEGVFFGQDKKAQAFRDWLDEVGGTSEKLEEGTFLDPSLPVNTSVSARMVVIDKVAALYSRTEEENPVVELTGAELDGSFEAARDYFRQHLQGQTVHRAEIGNIRVTGKGWHKAKRGLKTDTLKAKLFPAIQPIIEHGTYHGRETVEGRADDIVAFHYFDGSVLIGGDAVQVGVTVAEDSRGNLFYNLNHDADRLWQKSKKARHELRLEARGGKPSADGDSSPSKYSIATGYQPVNLAVLSRGGMGGSTGNTTANVTTEAESFLGRGYANLVKRGKLKIVQSVKDLPDVARGLFAAAWHGTPHKFDKFSTEHIGTGEGAQAYGHGLYFASSRGVAEWYKEKLSDGLHDVGEKWGIGNNEGGGYPVGDDNQSIFELTDYFDSYVGEYDDLAVYRKGSDFIAVADANGPWAVNIGSAGNLYQVELAPQEDEYLLWDKPLSEQSEKVREALSEAMGPGILKDGSGQNLYNHLSGNMSLGSQQAASEYLHSLGIRGIKYLDGTSRGKGEGDYNYVIFNDADVEIQAIYSKNGDIAGVYQDGTIHLVADQIAEGETAGLLKHEGLHLLLRNDERFAAIKNDLIERVRKLKKIDKRVQEAYGMVPDDTPAELIDEEAAAYLVQHHQQHGLVRRVIAAVRAWLVRMGLPPKTLDADVIAALASQGIRSYAARESGGAGSSRAGEPVRYSVSPAVLTGDSGLGNVTVSVVGTLPFSHKLLGQDVQEVSVGGGNVLGLRRIAKEFGKTIVFFREGEGIGDHATAGLDGDAGGHGRAGDRGRSRQGSGAGKISGFVRPSEPGKIYLNVDSPNHLLFVLGHELGHTLRAQDESLWRRTVEELKPLLKNWSDYRERLSDPRYAALSEQGQMEELVGDVFGDQFLTRAFWEDLAQRNPSLFTRIARKAVALLTKALRLMAGRDVSRYITDLEQARAVVAKALIEYGENVKGGVYKEYADAYDRLKVDGRFDGNALLNLLESAGWSRGRIESVIGGARLSVEENGEIPATLQVNGVERPTTNSKGRPIHATEEGIRSFWRWFDHTGAAQRERDVVRQRGLAAQDGAGQDDAGDHGAAVGVAGAAEAGVDGSGQPIVYYHGTRDDFSAFDLEHGNRKDHGWLGRGVYLTDTAAVANSYANNKRGDGFANVMPVSGVPGTPYLSLTSELGLLQFAHGSNRSHHRTRFATPCHPAGEPAAADVLL